MPVALSSPQTYMQPRACTVLVACMLILGAGQRLIQVSSMNKVLIDLLRSSSIRTSRCGSERHRKLRTRSCLTPAILRHCNSAVKRRFTVQRRELAVNKLPETFDPAAAAAEDVQVLIPCAAMAKDAPVGDQDFLLAINEYCDDCEE